MKESRWTDRVRNEVLRRVKRRGTFYIVIRRKCNWIGRTLRSKCFSSHVTERKIEGRSGGKTRKKTYEFTGWRGKLSEEFTAH